MAHPDIAMPQRPTSRRLSTEERELAPRWLLRSVAALLALCLSLVSYARITDQPLMATPPESPIVQERVLRIFPRMDGSAKVVDAYGALVADLAPDQGGFISGVARALARVRDTAGVAPTAPVRLLRFEDGRLSLRDDLTGWRAELIGFGADNTAAFARLMKSGG